MNKNSDVRRTKPNRSMCVSNCVICSKDKSRFIKNQEAGGLGIRSPLSNIPLISDILFYGSWFVLIIFIISLK